MDAQNRLGTVANRSFDLVGVDIESGRLDIDERWNRFAIANAVRGRYEGETHRDDLITIAYSQREQGKVERGRAVSDCARVLRPHKRGELPFERSDLGTLRHPAGKNWTRCSFCLSAIKPRLGNGYEKIFS